MVLWGCPSLIYSQTGNQKKQFKNLPIGICQASCFKMIQTEKNQFVGFIQKGHATDILPYSQLCCLPYWFAEEHNCDMHPYIMESHYVKYAGLFTSTYAIDTISLCVLIFHRNHPWIYWRRILPKSKLSWWLWGYGIWCNTIDSRWGAKCIYIKDQHANTYASVWGLFPVGKIWSSHSTIKSRFVEQ